MPGTRNNSRLHRSGIYYSKTPFYKHKTPKKTHLFGDDIGFRTQERGDSDYLSPDDDLMLCEGAVREVSRNKNLQGMFSDDLSALSSDETGGRYLRKAADGPRARCWRRTYGWLRGQINLSLSVGSVLFPKKNAKTELEKLCNKVNRSVNGINVFNSISKNIRLDTCIRVTNLYKISSLEMEIFLAEYCDLDGYISRRFFYKFFYNDIIGNSFVPNIHETTIEQFEVIEKLYNIFEKNNSGVIDYVELCCGLSPLCGDTMGEKAVNTFELFIVFNGYNGFTRKTMEIYLTSIFRLMYSLEPNKIIEDISPELLAKITTSSEWKRLGMKRNETMSLEDFKNWYGAINRM